MNFSEKYQVRVMNLIKLGKIFYIYQSIYDIIHEKVTKIYFWYELIEKGDKNKKKID
jgi:hypothetical protein